MSRAIAAAASVAAIGAQMCRAAWGVVEMIGVCVCGPVWSSQLSLSSSLSRWSR